MSAETQAPIPRPPAVLIVHNQYRVRGGEEQVIDNETALLRAHGHPVHTYFRSSGEIRGIGKALLALTAVFSLKTYRAVRRIIREAQIDIVHVHNTAGLISPSVYYAAWSLDVPVVQTLHNFRLLCPNGLFYREERICEDCVASGLRCAVRHGCYRGSRVQSTVMAFTLWLHRRLGTYRRVQAYIALTAFNRDKISALLPPGRVHIKPHFITAAQDAPDAPRGGYAYVGRLTREKGVWTLLEAFENMPELSLTIAGDGPELDSLRAAAPKNVRVLGTVDREGVQRIMAGTKALIMPTQLYETFGLVIIEAYASGTPVLGSSIGNVASLIEEGVTGYTFDPTDPGALSACVRRFEQSPVILPPDAAAPFDPEANYQRLMEIYREVLK